MRKYKFLTILAAAQAMTMALEKQCTGAGIEQNTARGAAAKAREDAAHLAGQVQALSGEQAASAILQLRLSGTLMAIGVQAR